MFRTLCIAALGLLVLAPSAARAATISLTAFSRGCYDAAGAASCLDSGQPEANYFTGTTDVAEHRGFFAFDLSSVVGTVVGASVTFHTRFQFYQSSDATETVGLFDYTGSIASLVGLSGGAAAFADLGDGISYGSRIVSEADNNNLITQTLLASAVAAINAAIGGPDQWAFGTAVTLLSGANEGVFGGSHGASTELTLITVDDVPEPATLLLLGSGVAVVAARRRIRQSRGI